MKRIVILVLAAMMAGLCACSAQTVWETVGGGCVRESDGASSVICVRLPQDAVEEVFAEAGTQHVYTQPGGGYEIVTQVLPAASMQSVVRSLSGFDASALRVYESAGRSGSSRGTPRPTRAGGCTAARSSRRARTATR